HYLWDEDMIDYSRLSYTELARFAGEPSAKELKMLYNSSVVNWIDETRQYTKLIYDNLGDKDYGYEYYNKFSPIFYEQIQKAGFRLGQLLNELMK
ncbi:MAG TPA: S1/P1 nuclease, partial [Draconibacterium sp.]|nr:S1/P1 nuclease [Draconibacterium sp.]